MKGTMPSRIGPVAQRLIKEKKLEGEDNAQALDRLLLNQNKFNKEELAEIIANKIIKKLQTQKVGKCNITTNLTPDIVSSGEGKVIGRPNSHGRKDRGIYKDPKLQAFMDICPHEFGTKQFKAYYARGLWNIHHHNIPLPEGNRRTPKAKKAIKESGANIEDQIDKKFHPQGYSVIILISESHASIHTFPEHEALFIDFFTCGNIDPSPFQKTILEAFKPYEIMENRIIDRPYTKE